MAIDAINGLKPASAVGGVNGVSGVTGTGGVSGISGVGSTEKADGDDFSKVLFNAIEKVNQADQEAAAAGKAVVTGDAESIHDAMVAGTKAELTLDFAVQMNTKAIEAYKEIMRLQL